MANLLLDIINRLKADGVVQGDGIDSFRDMMPDTPNEVISFVEYSGTPVAHRPIAVRNIQISVRSKSYEVARTKCNEIYQALKPEDSVFDKDATGRWFIGSAKQTPFKLKEDASKRVIYVFNYAVTTYMD